MDTIRINGSDYHFISRGKGGPVVILGSSKEHENYAENVFERTCGISDAPFTLFVFEVSDWDADFSPWSFCADTSSWSFAGNGRATLSRIENDLMPYVKSHFGSSPVYIAGYSLAGLFALWAMYESDCFAGAASCSGSLWFSGWTEYMKNAKAPAGASVYLSLGGKEEKCADPLVSTIGDCTRLSERLLAEDPAVARSKLEMNKGGHFADSAKRLAKGIKYIIEG